MPDATSLAARMKRYEQPTRLVLPPRTLTIIRVDGRAFHSYLRHAERPFDFDFIDHMGQVAAALCEEISGAVLAYHQSDEISVIVQDFATHGTQPWFGGELQKIVSLSASIATAHLARLRPGPIATFDARAFTIGDPAEVANYLIWRQRDAVKNSITMAAQARFSAKRLHGMHSGQRQELLWSEAGINWNDYPAAAKRGQVAVRRVGERGVRYTDKRTGVEQVTSAVRSWWEVEPAETFTPWPTGWLADVIPTAGQSEKKRSTAAEPILAGDA